LSVMQVSRLTASQVTVAPQFLRIETSHYLSSLLSTPRQSGLGRQDEGGRRYSALCVRPREWRGDSRIALERSRVFEFADLVTSAPNEVPSATLNRSSVRKARGSKRSPQHTDPNRFPVRSEGAQTANHCRICPRAWRKCSSRCLVRMGEGQWAMAQGKE